MMTLDIRTRQAGALFSEPADEADRLYGRGACGSLRGRLRIAALRLASYMGLPVRSWR